MEQTVIDRAEELVEEMGKAHPLYIWTPGDEPVTPIASPHILFRDRDIIQGLTKAQALALSVKKWRLIAQGHIDLNLHQSNLDSNTMACGLCHKYYYHQDGEIESIHMPCHGCPVYEDSGEDLCGGFQEYQDYHNVKNQWAPRVTPRAYQQAALKVAERLFNWLIVEIINQDYKQQKMDLRTNPDLFFGEDALS